MNRPGETILYDTKMVGTLVKTQELPTPEVNPKVSNGLWTITICSHRFINCNKCTPSEGLDKGC